MDEQHLPESPCSSSEDTVAFPIVGIGASAGGLPALIQLLENLPRAPGMALVVVLHLAPDAPSAVDRLLQRVTGLPVVQVRQRVRLLPDHIYVIAPGRSLTMKDGELISDEQQSTPGMPATINAFFRNLAEAYGEHAIGIVLSGMGSDGAAGLASIREHGGVTIAQLPGDAQESGMPQAAIDSGLADFVLRAAEMPARLMELRDGMRKAGLHERQRIGPGEAVFDMGARPKETLDAILALLRARTGQDCRHYKQATLLRRLGRRLEARGAPDLQAYFQLLQEDEQEPAALLQELLIGVTNFFRDREAFDALESAILPRLIQDKAPDAPLRVWVAACASGEEAYSIGMLLADYSDSEGPSAMQIFATDIDERAIAVARAGRYPEAIAADVPAERLARFFLREDDGFRVRKLLRDRILFARHDLVQDPAFSNLDLITCRNVLIYLNRDVQLRVLGMFHYALRPGAYLFLGSAESAELAPDLFEAVSGRHRLYQAKPAPKKTQWLSMAPAHPGPALQTGQTGAAVRQGEPRKPSFAELHQRTLLRIAPPSVLVDAKGEVVHASDDIAAVLRHGGGEPSAQVLALVPPGLRAELQDAMFQAAASGSAVCSGPLCYQQDGTARVVRLSVVPVEDAGLGKGLMMICFEAAPAPSSTGEAQPEDGQPADGQQRRQGLDEGLPQAGPSLPRIVARSAPSYGQLQKRNDALQARVETLRASVEELEIDREDMQSRNEELQTINAELKVRVDETSKAHDDLGNLIASSDIATLFLDLRLRIQRYTPHVTRIFNLIPADIGRPLAHLTHRLETKQLLDEVAEVFTTQQPIERELRSTDGRDYIVRVHPYRTAYDRVEGAVLTFFDITRRRTVEKALRESEQRLALAFAALPIGIGTVDTAGNTIILNDIMRRFLPTGTMPSRDPARMARWRAWDADGMPVQPRDFPGARALRGESMLSGMEMLYLNDDGTQTWTEVRSAPLRDSEGSISGALAVVIDVDRLKRSEETARESARHQTFLLALSDALRVARDPDAMATLALQMLLDVLQLDRCCIVSSRPGQDRAEVSHQVGNGAVSPLPATIRLSDCPQALGIALGRTLVIEDDDGRQDLPPAETRTRTDVGTLSGMRALVATTLQRGADTPAWSMAAVYGAPRHWTPGEIALVEAVAERTWTAIERARAEAMAARAERRAEAILEHMGDAHCVLDRNFRVLGANAAAERLLGARRDTLLGRSHWDAFPGSVDAPVGHAFRRVVEDGVEQHFTHHYTGEGYDLHLEVDAYPTDEGGIAVFWRNVTERVRTGTALRESEARFRALAEASPALIWQVDAAGGLNYVNERCLDVTGSTLDQLRGLGWHGVVHPDDMAGYLEAVARALRLQQAFQRRVRLRKRDGHHHWFESHALPWYTAKGQFRGLVGISIDVDEAVRAEEALKTADRRKDEFLATLAHELRNPLAPVSNALQFLRHPGGKRRADRLLAMVERQVRHMVRLVDDLMEVSRISRGKVELRRAPVALLEVLNSAVETSLPGFEQKRQQLTVEAPDESLRLDADKVRLTQVFANLLNNAAKYTAPGGQIWLTAKRDGTAVVVTVRDTGMGIPAEQLPIIFEMFSQPHGRDGHSESGLGIGLAMVRSLVELHGGSVGARSAGREKGSEFTVRLPLMEGPAPVPRAPDAGAERTATTLAGQRILVVDDNRDAADSLCELLAARGADARAVYEGRAAIEALDNAAPDAIVLDIGMPDMDGYEVASRIRRDKRAEGIQLVALSGWGQQADRQRSQACGFNHHLTKPAELDSLLEILSVRSRQGDGPQRP